MPDLDPDDPTYKWQKLKSGSTNTSDKWMVIIGAGLNVITVNNTIVVQIADGPGDTIDTCLFETVTSGSTMQILPRKMLAPPGSIVTSASGLFLSVVLC